MRCPKCGFEQPETESCIKCGVIVAKFLARQAKETAPSSDASTTVAPADSGEGGKVQSVIIRRGHKLIRNVKAKDLLVRIQAGELNESDEISSDGEKWMLAGLHPQLKNAFQEEKERLVSGDSKELRPTEPGPEPGAELSASMQSLQVFGALGAIALALGVFLPVVSIPKVGQFNYLAHSMGSAVFVLVFASLAIFVVAREQLAWLKYSGIAAFITVFLGFYDFKAQSVRLHAGMVAKFSGSAYEGLGLAVLQGVEMSWGWYVLGLGVAMILTAGLSYEIKVRWKPRRG